MPREAQPPRPNARPKGILSPQKGSIRGPLQDDREEKAVRFHSRQALHEIHINQIKAAAVSPARKARASPSYAASPKTPTTDSDQDQESQNLAAVGGTAVTPMKRMPILANFEEWMKMATDNKINATNSWNFALIDYFYDMSLLKEGDSVNFQKASCTLDGCVKIYTSRVDSVATETGKLLSGLADSANNNNNKKRGAADGDDESAAHDEDEEDQDGEPEDGEDGEKRRSKKRVQRSSEATLASSFAQLQLKKMDLEFSVDPLFKKASADFDEGGAKGLLLNHLTMDSHCRIVFDSSADDAPTNNDPEDEPPIDTKEVPEPQPAADFLDIDLGILARRFIPDLSRIDEQDICPSLKTYEIGGDADALDIPFLKAPEDWRNNIQSSQQSDLDEDGVGRFGDDDDDDAGLGGLDLVGEDVAFGEGGEAWAKEAALETQPLVFDSGFDEDSPPDDGSLEIGDRFGIVALTRGKDFDRDNILSYFDQTLQKNWAGPEHWRIQKIKDINKPTPPTARKKEKEPFEIDFAAPLSQAVADLIYTRAPSNAAISLPKAQWKSKTRNLLPDDKHFNSTQLLSLFLKPKARIGPRKSGRNGIGRQMNGPIPEGEINEAYWARKQSQDLPELADGRAQGDYDANFFQDDPLGFAGGVDDDDEDFADAREHLSPDIDQLPLGSIESIVPGENGVGGDGYGTQLVTQSRRLRPEYVQYARVAKKVDVRRLKEEMWKGLGLEDETTSSPTTEGTSIPGTPAPLEKAHQTEEEPLKFTSVMNSLQTVYPKQAMADISTSYCFICLLHLANEKGLVLEHEPNFAEIKIQRDHSAQIAEYAD